MAGKPSWKLDYDSNLPVTNPNYVHTNVDNFEKVINAFQKERLDYKVLQKKIDASLKKRKQREQALYKILGVTEEEFLDFFSSSDATKTIVAKQVEQSKIFDAVFGEVAEWARREQEIAKAERKGKVPKSTPFTERELRRIVTNAAKVFSATRASSIEQIMTKYNIDPTVLPAEEVQRDLNMIKELAMAKIRKLLKNETLSSTQLISKMGSLQSIISLPEVEGIAKAILNIQNAITGIWGEENVAEIYLNQILSEPADKFFVVGNPGKNKADVQLAHFSVQGSFPIAPGFSVKSSRATILRPLTIHNPGSFNALLNAMSDKEHQKWIRYLFVNESIYNALRMGSTGHPYSQPLQRDQKGKRALLNKVDNLLNDLVASDASIWLAGTSSSLSEADFFIYNHASESPKMLPMSQLLEIIKTNLTAGASKIIQLKNLRSVGNVGASSMSKNYYEMYLNKTGWDVQRGIKASELGITPNPDAVNEEMTVISNKIIATTNKLQITLNWKLLTERRNPRLK